MFKRHYYTPPYILISYIVLLLIFSGCLSIKPSASKSGKKYFETFYVGEEGTQYFIKPISFIDENLYEELIIDITFRYRNIIKDSAIVNFSIRSSDIYKNVDTFKLSNKKIEIQTDRVELIYNEKNNKGYISRHSTKVSLNELKELFNNDDWLITVENSSKITNYKANRKTIRVINTIRDRVFILM